MTEVIEIKPKGRYGASRHNAMKHGLKSEQMVLPWERQEDFEHLQKSLLDEYRPQTTTQRELVNMLFLTFWRMRRAGVAENAIIQNEYERLSSQSPDRTLRMGDDEIRKEIEDCKNRLTQCVEVDEKLRIEKHLRRLQEIPKQQRQAGYTAMFTHDGLERVGRYEAGLRRSLARTLGLLHDLKTIANGDLIEG